MLDYVAVSQWLNKRELLAHLCTANVRRLGTQESIALAQRILGKRTIVRVKKTRTSWAYSHNESITLSCDARRTVKLVSILHECAHVLDYRKGRVLGHSAHGEPFKRTYARLLREHADPFSS